MVALKVPCQLPLLLYEPARFTLQFLLAYGSFRLTDKYTRAEQYGLYSCAKKGRIILNLVENGVFLHSLATQIRCNKDNIKPSQETQGCLRRIKRFKFLIGITSTHIKFQMC